jgi:hypothetical protein
VADVRIGDTLINYTALDLTWNGNYLSWVDGNTQEAWYCQVDMHFGTLHPADCRGHFIGIVTLDGAPRWLGDSASWLNGNHHVALSVSSAGEILWTNPIDSVTALDSAVALPPDITREGVTMFWPYIAYVKQDPTPGVFWTRLDETPMVERRLTSGDGGRDVNGNWAIRLFPPTFDHMRADRVLMFGQLDAAGDVQMMGADVSAPGGPVITQVTSDAGSKHSPGQHATAEGELFWVGLGESPSIGIYSRNTVDTYQRLRTITVANTAFPTPSWASFPQYDWIGSAIVFEVQNGSAQQPEDNQPSELWWSRIDGSAPPKRVSASTSMVRHRARVMNRASDGAAVIFYIGKSPGAFRWELRRIIVPR